jgi:hypothetical protein
MKYLCTICGWIGEEEELVELTGYLWDYTEHKACPRCWEEDALDNSVTKVERWLGSTYLKMLEEWAEEANERLKNKDPDSLY